MNQAIEQNKFGGPELLQQLRNICYEIEKLPPSTHQTNLISKVSDASFALQQLQATGDHFWPFVMPSVPKPSLNEGEIHAFSVIKSDGAIEHVILLPGDNGSASWDEQMTWAKSIGGDLPDRSELALLYKHLRDQFQGVWYWSNTQHASGSDYVWYQDFDGGYQFSNHKNDELRARAVRRSSVIQ
jgi:hypothetical protein